MKKMNKFLQIISMVFAISTVFYFTTAGTVAVHADELVKKQHIEHRGCP